MQEAACQLSHTTLFTELAIRINLHSEAVIEILQSPPSDSLEKPSHSFQSADVLTRAYLLLTVNNQLVEVWPSGFKAAQL